MPHASTASGSGRRSGNRGEGLGLGLFIARTIARAHGGELEVQSAAGKTLFRLVLPRRPAPPEVG